MVSLLITCPCCTWLMHTLPWQTCAALDDICIWNAPRFSTVGTSYFFLHPLVWSFPWLSFLGRILDSSQQNPLQLIYKEKGVYLRVAWGFPGGSVVKNPPAKQETWVHSPGWEDPLEKEMATHSSILAWKSHGWRSLAGLQSMGSQKSRT